VAKRRLLDVDLGAGLFELGLGGVGLVLGDALLDGLGRAVRSTEGNIAIAGDVAPRAGRPDLMKRSPTYAHVSVWMSERRGDCR